MKFLDYSSKLLTLGIMASLFSCASESPWGQQEAKEGRIELTVLTDANVSVGTRAGEDNENQAIQPDKENFSISLVSNDGSIDKTWESISKFNSEEGFPMGSYTISAEFGDPEEEGFENPYYYGEENIEVSLGHTTVQTLTARLGNSMLSIRYNDDLKSIFKKYSASAQTEGHDAVAYVQEEERPAYLFPGEAKIFVTLTNDKDETVTVNPVDIDMEARHHYILTLGVNKDNLGNNVLSVNITEDIIKETPLDIILSDEFFSAPIPVISAKGFDPEKSFDFFEAMSEEIENPQIHVMALAGLNSAKLKLSSEGSKLPVWNTAKEEIELVNAEEEVKSKLAEANLKCFGFFENAADFGYVDFTDYVKNLGPGSYTASLQITDKLGRTSDIELPEIVLKANVDEVKYEISGYINPDFLSKEIVLAISTNCERIKEILSFEANDENGGISSVEAKEVETPPTIQNFDTSYPHTYYFKLQTDVINDNQWTVIARYAAKTSMEIIDVVLPQFDIDTDAFAKRVKVWIKASDATMSENIARVINVKDGDNLIKAENIDRTQADKGIIIVKGLNSRNQLVDNVTFDGVYNLNLYLGKKMARKDYTGSPFRFTTEEALEVPNGDFEELGDSQSIEINQGGPWKSGTSGALSTKVSYTISNPNFWATTNGKTMSGTTENTWFVQPSVFNTSLNYNSKVPGYSGILGFGSWSEENSTPAEYRYNPQSGENAMVIRNVGWAAEGTAPSTVTNSQHYNQNQPSTPITSSVGKMFLGEYGYNNNGSETYNDKVEFTSRPFSLKGWYMYDATIDSSDNGIVTVVLFAGDDIIAEGTSDLSQTGNDYSQFNIALNYKEDSAKKEATKLKLMLASSKKSDNDVVINALNSKFQAYFHGNTLVVDNLEFEY